MEAFIADHARLLARTSTHGRSSPQAVVHEDDCSAAFARGLTAITEAPRLDNAAVEAYSARAAWSSTNNSARCPSRISVDSETAFQSSSEMFLS